MRRRSALIVAVALLAAACSTSDGAGEETTTTSTLPAPTTTTTVAPPTTTATTVPATTTTAPPPATTTTTDVNQLAEGSGCTPNTEILPDGIWYGIVDSHDAGGISFDLACWFTGDAAVVASAEDGAESPPPNDYYVRNQNDKLRDLEVSPTTPVRWYLSGDPNDYTDGTFTDWVAFLDTVPFHLGVWVTIQNGVVSWIQEQWVP